MNKLVTILILAMALLFPLATFARDVVEYDVDNHIMWFNPVAWNTLSYENKVKAISEVGMLKASSRVLGSWTCKAMGSGLKLATFEIDGSGARNIKILVN